MREQCAQSLKDRIIRSPLAGNLNRRTEIKSIQEVKIKLEN